MYDILGVGKYASPEEIKKAYKKKAQQSHPDRKRGSVEQFKKIAKAYEILSDPVKRLNYDNTGTTGESATNESLAVSLVTNLFIANLGHDSCLHTNIIKLVQHSLSQHSMQALKAIRSNSEVKNRLLKVKKKLKYTGTKADFLNFAIAKNIKIAEDSNIALNNELEVFAIAETLIDDFEFTPDGQGLTPYV